MSETCEITGLSPENIEKFSYLHDSITKNTEISAPENDVLKGFIRPLESIVNSNKTHNSDVKRRQSLLKHLEKSISSKFELEDISFSSGGPAKYSKIKGSDIKLGFITPLSHNFCSSCNRIRVDATGVLHQCLGQSNSLDFRKILRNPSYNDTDLFENIRKSIRQKPEKHSFAYDFSKQHVEGTIDTYRRVLGIRPGDVAAVEALEDIFGQDPKVQLYLELPTRQWK